MRFLPHLTGLSTLPGASWPHFCFTGPGSPLIGFPGYGDPARQPHWLTAVRASPCALPLCWSCIPSARSCSQVPSSLEALQSLGCGIEHPKHAQPFGLCEEQRLKPLTEPETLTTPRSCQELQTQERPYKKHCPWRAEAPAPMCCPGTDPCRPGAPPRASLTPISLGFS